MCLHGLMQHGGVFEPLARRLVASGAYVVAVDLRGHGASGHEPPWHTEAHAADVLETMAALGIARATLIGHSFGGLVAAALAASSEDRIRGVALLDPSLGLAPEQVLKYVEIDRQDWGFATQEGALNALLASDRLIAAPRDTLAAFVADDVRAGDDGLFRFSYHPGSVVVGWSEAAREPPPVAPLPTLLVRPAASFVDGREQDRRYRLALGCALTIEAVPNGHNVLWESPLQTAAGIQAWATAPALRRAVSESATPPREG